MLQRLSEEGYDGNRESLNREGQLKCNFVCAKSNPIDIQNYYHCQHRKSVDVEQEQIASFYILNSKTKAVQL